MVNVLEEEEENENKFWEDGGINDQLTKQISDHIAKHRDVTDESCRPDLLKDWKEEDRKLSDSGAYRDQVSFSAYPFDGPNAYTNNLMEIAIQGRVQLKTKHQDFFGGMSPEVRKDYESEILENPTWLDLCLCANDMINAGGDNHHIFLEAVHKTGSFTLDDKSFVLIYDFSMGS